MTLRELWYGVRAMKRLNLQTHMQKEKSSYLLKYGGLSGFTKHYPKDDIQGLLPVPSSSALWHIPELGCEAPSLCPYLAPSIPCQQTGTAWLSLQTVPKDGQADN